MAQNPIALANMPKKKFFEKNDFKKLNAQWDKKLKAANFDDIRADGKSNIIKQQKFKPHTQFQSGKEYQELCNAILEQFPFSRTVDVMLIFTARKQSQLMTQVQIIESFWERNPNANISKSIFEFHAEGISNRTIKDQIEKKWGISVGETTIRKIIKLIKTQFHKM